MKRGAQFATVMLACAMFARAGFARAAPAESPSGDILKQAIGENGRGFCAHRTLPLTARAKALCPLAREVPDCQGFVDACTDAALPPPESRRQLRELLGLLGRALLTVIGAAALLFLVLFVRHMIVRTRRDAKLADTKAMPKSVTIAAHSEAPPPLSEPLALLQRGDECAAAGAWHEALTAYWLAALRALEQRGALRTMAHRTFGEYVATCTDGPARPMLRSIVRNLDGVHFGGEPPSLQMVRAVREKVIVLIRGAALATMLVAILLMGGGCGMLGDDAGKDPAGDGLFLSFVRSRGFELSSQVGPLSSLPLPREGETPEALLIDLERIPLEDETRAHLTDWVKAGGTLIVFGGLEQWPTELAANDVDAPSNELRLATAQGPEVEDDDVDDVDEQPSQTPRDPGVAASPPDDARLARPAGFTAIVTPIAWAGHMVYAGVAPLGDGEIVVVANDDLLTNVGLARPGNASIALAIVSRPGLHRLRIARRGEGSAPPSSPLAAIGRLELGPFMGQTLVAVAILFLAVGVRTSRPAEAELRPRRTFVEHVKATGALYAEAHAVSHAVGAMCDFIEGQVRARSPSAEMTVPRWLSIRTTQPQDECQALWDWASARRKLHSGAGSSQEQLAAAGVGEGEVVQLGRLVRLYAAAAKDSDA